MSTTASNRSHNIEIPSYKNLHLGDIDIDGNYNVGHDDGSDPHTEDEKREQKRQEPSKENAPRIDNERRKRVMFASTRTASADHNA